MFSLFRELGVRHALRRELPALAAAMLLAELFYKFGSLTLELVALLATWTLLSAVQAKLLK